MEKANKIRLFLAIAVVLIASFVVVTVALRMHRGGAPKKAVEKLPVQVDVSLKRIHYTETRQGKKRWDLSAQRAEYNRGRDVTALFDVKLVLAGPPSLGEFTVSADRADYQNSSQDVTLAGNVRGVSAKGLRFSAPEVRYLAGLSRLETAQRVLFEDGGLQLEGVGMEFDTQTQKLKLLKDVSAVYRPQGKR